MRRTLLSLLVTLALAAPAAAQPAPPAAAAVGWQTFLDLTGPQASGAPTTDTVRRYTPGAPLTVGARIDVWSKSGGALTLTFTDPNDAAEIWFADASGSYVAAYSFASASPDVIPANTSQSFGFAWDQTDWNGNPLPVGIYSVEAVIYADQGPWSLDKIYFEIGDRDSSASAFNAYVVCPPPSSTKTPPPPPAPGRGVTVFRSGEPIRPVLVTQNLTNEPEVVRFDHGDATIDVFDRAGNPVWSWDAASAAAAAPPDPADVFVRPLDSFPTAPASWPAQDASGQPVPLGTYTIVMRALGRPAVADATLDVTIGSGGTIRVSGAQYISVRKSPAASARLLGIIAAGAPVAVLWQGRRWDEVAGLDINGNPVRGFVPKRYVHIP